MKKIAQISVSYIGAQKKIEDAIHQTALHAGIESRVFYCLTDRNLKTDRRTIRLYSNFIFFCLRVSRKLFGKKFLIAVLPTRKLIRQLDAFSPDLVHLHVIHGGLLDYPMLLRYLAKKAIPVVWTMHDMWAFTGGCYHYSEQGCEQYKTGCKHCQKNRKLLDNLPARTNKHWLLKKELMASLNRVSIVAVSQWVDDQVGKSFLREYERTVVYNGLNKPNPEKIDLSVSCDSRLAWRRDTNDFMLIAAANYWGKGKGLHYACQIAQRLGDDYHLLLVGHCLASPGELPSNIHLWGYEPDPEVMRALYGLADLNLSFSVEETFGMTFLEAALCGVRSVGFDKTAIGEIVPQLFGYVVESASTVHMEDIIRKCRSGQLPGKMTGEELSDIEEKFSAERMVGEYMKIYEKIMKESGTGNGAH